MSFILDALKKSEHDRQKQGGPALFEVRVAPPASRLPIWAVIVGVLLGVNLVVLVAVLLLRDKPGNPARPPDAPLAASASTPASAAPPPVTSAPAAPAIAAPEAGARFNPPLLEEDAALTEDAVSVRGAPINPADYQPAGTGQTMPLGAPGAYGAIPSTSGGLAAGAGSAETSGVPSRSDLVAAGKGGIPEASLSLHVYDRNPAARFVFVNGQRAREGDVLANGLRVDEIRADGAVLSFAGSRFLVPIQ